MKQFKFTLLLIAAFSVLLTSCDTGSNVKYVQKNKILILNQGNYTSQDASVYVYDEDTQIMTPNAFAKANNNTKLGATLMSGTYSNYGIGYLLCSNPDKIEVINVLTMQTLSNPIEKNLLNTREIILGDEFIFVTNAGADHRVAENGMYEYYNSYVSVYSQVNHNPLDTIYVGSDAQGMIYLNNTLYVGTKQGIARLEKDGNTFVKIEVYTDEEYTGAVKYMCYYNNMIYASIPGYGIIAYDPLDNKVRTRYPVANILDSDGFITVDKDGYIYTYANDWNIQSACVNKLDTKTGEVGTLYEGENIIGLGVSPYSNNLFISESNGWQTNSTTNIMDIKTGTPVSQQVAGVGAFRYLFYYYFEQDNSSNEK